MVSINYLALRTIEKIKNLFPYQPIIKTEPKGNHTHVPIVFYFGVIKPAPAQVSETPKETPQAKVEEKAEEKKDKKKDGSGVLTLVIGGALLIASFGAINYFRKQ